MRFIWITYGLDNPQTPAESKVATNRYRVALPAIALSRLGHDVAILDLPSGSEATVDIERVTADADLVIFAKIIRDASTADMNSGFAKRADVYRSVVARISEPERRVVYDLNDFHFDSPGFADFYDGVGQRARFWSVCSLAFTEEIRHRTRVPVVEIPDPYDGPHGTPRVVDEGLGGMLSRFNPLRRNPEIRFLWFGHQTNVQALMNVIPKLEVLARRHPLEIHIVTGPQQQVIDMCNADDARPRGFRARFTPWSRASTWDALKDCDVVLLPADLSTTQGRLKSSNRMVEVLRAGRVAIAQPLPSYLEFRDFAWVGERLEEGCEWFLENRKAAAERATDGQSRVEQSFSPEAIAQRWIKLATNAP